MAVFITKSVSTGRRGFRICSSGDQRNTRVTEEFVERTRAGRRQDAPLDVRCEHDVVGQVPGERFGHKGTLRKI